MLTKLLEAVERERGRPVSSNQVTLYSGEVVNVKISDRVLTESVTRHVLSKAARGPSTLVGGSLTTGD